MSDSVFTTHKARKSHRCNSCKFIAEHVAEMGNDLPEDQRIVTDRLLIERKGRIPIGEVYNRHAMFDGGHVYVWRSGVEADDFCEKHKLFPED